MPCDIYDLNIFTKVHLQVFIYIQVVCHAVNGALFLSILVRDEKNRHSNTLTCGPCGSSKSSRIINFFANITMLAL